MDKVIRYLFLAGIIGLLTVSFGFCARGKSMDKTKRIVDQVTSAENVISLFQTSPEEIKQLTQLYIDEAKQEIDKIIAIPDDQRTFANTAQALDDLCGLANIDIFGGLLSGIENTNPDEKIRNAAHQAMLQISTFAIDNISNNKKLYQAFKAYAQGNAKKENLSPEQRYFIDENMKSFKRAGLELPDDQLAQVGKLKKELTDLSLKFSRNIAQDKSTITVSKDELKGLSDDFINTLKLTDDGLYILGMDYPTVFNVLDNCTVEGTRKKLSEAFNNRAYPDNETLLKQIIAKRDELADKLAFKSYAALDLDSQMVKTPERAQQFILDLIARSNRKVDTELALQLKNMPTSVSLTKNGKIKPWDVRYIENQYKKKHLNVDENKVSEYFPMQNTIKELLDIYSKFLSITFKEVPVTGLWDKDVKFVEVYDKSGKELLGYLFLDLYPRPNKFSHAAHWGILPATCNGKRIPSIGLVVANFPKGNGDKPALLKRQDVSTFFHEFGHALHNMLGCTQLATQAGTSVKTDFVELPSQILEEWLWDKDILKKVSKHYKTGEPLPDELIDNILKLKTYDSGYFVQRQGCLSLISLDYYKPGADKDPYAIMKHIFKEYKPRFMFDDTNHFYASFGHLTGYGAKYYGYLWSKVFALDVFNQIKEQGLLNPEVGQKYINTIIGRGGSADPNELLKDFLGREPRIDAFLKSMGLE